MERNLLVIAEEKVKAVVVRLSKKSPLFQRAFLDLLKN